MTVSRRVSRHERRGLYWASNGWTFPRTEDQVILPRRWIAESALFGELSRDPSPTGIAALAARLPGFDAQPSLEKCVAELVYEQVRQRESSDAPSRLDCLFAAPDMMSAIQFAAKYIPLQIDPTGMANQMAAPVSTADGAWVELDMNLFGTTPLAGLDEAEMGKALVTLTRQAQRYWRGEESQTPFGEILAEKLWLWTVFIDEGGQPPEYSVWMESRRKS